MNETILTDLMHVAPELIEERTNNIGQTFRATADGDIFALGCIVNEIILRRSLYDRSFKDDFNENRLFRVSRVGKYV